MRYISTSPTNAVSVDFRETFYHPVATDGSIYMPQQIPVIPAAVFKNLEGMSLTDCAYIISTAILGQYISPSILREITATALNFDIPLHRLSENIMSLELFHGPTLGVRDIGTRFLASFIKKSYCGKTDEQLNIIAATAGDTGIALAEAMKDVPGAHVYILHPNDEAGRDKRTGFMLSGENVTSIGVKGSLDQCMKILYALLSERDFTSANNIICGNTLNLIRLLPLIVPFFHAKAQMHRTEICKPDDQILFALPSGSLALLTAGVIACRMGLGNVRFVVACSKEHSFSNFLQTGIWRNDNAKPSIAGALDVSYPVNFPRLLHIYGGSLSEMSKDITAEEISDSEIVDTMQNTLSEYGYLMEPHTAATACALCRQLRPGEKGVILAPTHPAKFGTIIQENTRIKVPSGVSMDRIQTGGLARQHAIPPTLSALKKFLREQKNMC